MILMKQLRLTQEISQAQLARDTGLNAGSISQIELGRLKPYESQLEKIATALGHPVGNADGLLRQVFGTDDEARAYAYQDMDYAFERLGIAEKLEEIKPDIEKCKQSFIYGSCETVEIESLKRLVEFIECLDEPQE